MLPLDPGSVRSSIGSVLKNGWSGSAAGVDSSAGSLTASTASWKPSRAAPDKYPGVPVCCSWVSPATWPSCSEGGGVSEKVRGVEVASGSVASGAVVEVASGSVASGAVVAGSAASLRAVASWMMRWRSASSSTHSAPV